MIFPSRTLLLQKCFDPRKAVPLAKGSEITPPLDVPLDMLLEPAFARAAALAAFAAMRRSSPTSDEHNRLASFALDTGYMP